MTNRIIDSLWFRLAPYLFRILNRKIRGNFTCSYLNPDLDKFVSDAECEDIIPVLEYRDECWDQIKNIGRNMRDDGFRNIFMFPNRSLSGSEGHLHQEKATVMGSSIHIKSQHKKNDWVFISPNKSYDQPYVVEFDAKLSSELSEFQFAFNFQSIGRRYRFNQRNNSVLSFEVVHAGFFHNHLIDVPMKLELGRFYRFRILVTNARFLYEVDGRILLDINQKKALINDGKFAFILWDSDNSNIDVIYKNVKIYTPRK